MITQDVLLEIEKFDSSLRKIGFEVRIFPNGKLHRPTPDIELGGFKTSDTIEIVKTGIDVRQNAGSHRGIDG